MMCAQEQGARSMKHKRALGAVDAGRAVLAVDAGLAVLAIDAVLTAHRARSAKFFIFFF